MDAREFEALLSDVETRLERIKALYEQWFQGIERLEPLVLRKEIDRRLDRLKREQPRNTALRFRFQQVVQRYTTYATYWGRVGRQIEEGTYKRDVLRAKRNREELRARRRSGQTQIPQIDIDVDVDTALDDGITGAPEFGLSSVDGPSHAPNVLANPAALQPSSSPTNLELDLDTDIDAALSTLKPASVPPPRSIPKPPSPPLNTSTNANSATNQGASKPKAPPVPPPKPPISTDATESKQVVDRKPPLPPPARVPPPPPVEARRNPPPAQPSGQSNHMEDDRMRAIYNRYIEARKKNQESTSVQYETWAKSIRRMLPDLEKKHGNKAIDFEVVVKDGRVGLKPVPKR